MTPYLDAVVKETLRARTVVPGIGRVVRGEPFERLGDYVIPDGIEINPSIAAVHRRPDCYPEPKEFRPGGSSAPMRPTTSLGFHSAAEHAAASVLTSPASRCVSSSGG